MATRVMCDWCNKEIAPDGVVYRIETLDPMHIDSSRIVKSTHLHYGCIAMWVTSE